ncbi:MAG: hypothetical protein APF76_10930 [Desulfitibacter sp. BRH_c19]|nr:MAG: hypothetical protein APF76_10930 [Desulfitibacter sp. BRH_c19]
MRVIDVHCHIHRQGWVKVKKSNDFIIRNFNYEADEEVILANMEEGSIASTIIFPLPSVEIDIEAGNRYAVEAARKHTGRFIPFTVVDDKPQYWVEQGVKGFKEHTFGQRIQKDYAGRNIFSQRFKKTYRFMEKHGLPLLLHGGENKIERLTDDMLKDTPKLTIILAHLGADYLVQNKYLPEINQISSTLEALNKYPNVYYDISTITDEEILKRALEIVGAKKLLFGSDFPYEKPITTLKRFNSLDCLTQEDRELVLYKNIEKLLNQNMGCI